MTWQAMSSWAVDEATALAAAMSFSSWAWPCTTELAASHKLPVAEATSLACQEREETQNHDIHMYERKFLTGGTSRYIHVYIG